MNKPGKTIIWRLRAALLLPVILGLSGCAQERTGFDAALVEAKQKCQEAFAKWKEEHIGHLKGANEEAIRAHFNTKLNACLVDYSLDDSEIAHSNSYQVIDIFDGRRVLLELDLELPGNSTGKVGQYLYESGKEVTAPGDKGREYRRRLAGLFQEPDPGY